MCLTARDPLIPGSAPAASPSAVVLTEGRRSLDRFVNGAALRQKCGMQETARRHFEDHCLAFGVESNPIELMCITGTHCVIPYLARRMHPCALTG